MENLLKNFENGCDSEGEDATPPYNTFNNLFSPQSMTTYPQDPSYVPTITQQQRKPLVNQPTKNMHAASSSMFAPDESVESLATKINNAAAAHDDSGPSRSLTRKVSIASPVEGSDVVDTNETYPTLSSILPHENGEFDQRDSANQQSSFDPESLFEQQKAESHAEQPERTNRFKDLFASSESRKVNDNIFSTQRRDNNSDDDVNKHAQDKQQPQFKTIFFGKSGRNAFGKTDDDGNGTSEVSNHHNQEETRQERVDEFTQYDPDKHAEKNLDLDVYTNVQELPITSSPQVNKESKDAFEDDSIRLALPSLNNGDKQNFFSDSD